MSSSMASLNNLLNPENTSNGSRRRQGSHPLSRSASPPATDNGLEPATSEQYYAHTDVRPHDPHPDCPNTLTCLPDTEGRPQHTLPVILRCAILGSPKKRLTIREIYAAMEKKYPYYLTAGPAWKQSVRHHLSLNRLFERQPRPATDPGFGSYWTVNLEAPPGTKRPRKRGRTTKDSTTPVAVGPSASTSATTPPLTRPSIGNDPHSAHEATIRRHSLPDHPPIATLRPVDSRSFSQLSSVRANGKYEEEDEEDDEMTWDESGDGAQLSEDYESEDGASPAYEPRRIVQPNRPVLHGAFSGYSSTEPTDATVERLKMEMAGLRRQSTDAVAASMRLSNQLAQAQAEASRVRVALKIAENRLEEEARRRYEAEMTADEESRRRRTAEEALRAYQSQRRPSGY